MNWVVWAFGLIMLTGCIDTGSKKIRSLQLSLLQTLSVTDRLLLATHMPGVFHLSEICALLVADGEPLPIFPGDDLPSNDQPVTVRCEGQTINLMAQTKARIWRVAENHTAVDLQSGAVSISAAPGKFTLSSATNQIHLESKGRSTFAIAQITRHPDFFCSQGEINLQSSDRRLGLHTSACLLRAEFETNVNIATILPSESLWLGDVSLPQHLRPRATTPPSPLLPYFLPVPVAPIIRLNPDRATLQWETPEANSACQLLTRKGPDADFLPVVGSAPLAGNRGSLPAAPLGKGDFLLRCELTAGPAFSGMLRL